MSNLTPQQQKKLLMLAEVADNGDLAIVKFIFELQEKIEAEIPSIKDVIERLKGDKEDADNLAEKGRQEVITAIKDYIDIDSISSLAANKVRVPVQDIAIEAAKFVKVEHGKSPTVEQLLDLIEPLIPDPVSPRDVAEIATAMVIEKLGNEKEEEETVKDIVKKINDSDEKIEVERISGIKNYSDEIATLQNRTQLLLQISTQRTSGGVTVETPTGTVNGSNNTFTVAKTPKFVIIDGMFRVEGFGYTYAGVTITVDPTGPPVQFIRSYY